MPKILLLIASLTPLAWLIVQALEDRLGANAVEAIIHRNGDLTLIFLMITLSMTPLRLITGWSGWIRYRRMLGLFAFFYATLHVLSYIGLDLHFDWTAISHDVIKHPYVFVGLAAYLTLIPLAATSNNWSVRKLKTRWKALHKLAYLAPMLGVLHYLWLVKKDLSQPLIYGAVLLVLLAIRRIYPSNWRSA